MVGLKRAGFSLEEIRTIKTAYRLLYRSGLKQEDALARIEKNLPGPHTHELVNFVRRSKRGICRERSEKSAQD
jgi:UDP-N-acetylglucosamine acyltransferase